MDEAEESIRDRSTDPMERESSSATEAAEVAEAVADAVAEPVAEPESWRRECDLQYCPKDMAPLGAGRDPCTTRFTSSVSFFLKVFW